MSSRASGEGTVFPGPVRGFRVASVRCGIKTSGHDLGVIFCQGDHPSSAAVFTRNQVCAAPVMISRKHARSGHVRAVVVNSGCANCCTGDRGMKDAVRMAELTARHLGIGPREVLVASTGVIGRHLAVGRISKGIAAACSAIAAADNRTVQKSGFPRMIMTTDTFPKTAVRRVRGKGEPFTVAGTAKGSGMIAPNMGTMLAFILTDLRVEAGLLREPFRRCVEGSFNRVVVDGDTSTNDTAVLLSSGMSGRGDVRGAGSKRFRAFVDALEAVCGSLARQIARDGEGATKLIEVVVSGARLQPHADLAARAIISSPLVKCAMHGADPNWGRILAAAGRSGAKVEEKKTTVKVAGVTVFRRGKPVRFDEKALSRRLAKSEEVRISMDLGLGKARSEMFGCDLSAEYVSINAHYHT